MLAGDDTVIDLRAPDEAPLITDQALRLSLADLDHAFTPPPRGRVVFCCRSGQRAWQAAEHLSSRWYGRIALLAVGTTCPINTGPTDTGPADTI
jgi:rhodanese-related sulfurtransferase